MCKRGLIIMELCKIAIIMTCYNRRDLTIACLERVFSQKNIGDTSLEIFLVDDGSTDGTGAVVRQKYPKAKVLYGNGTLFWVGGMRVAFGEALKGNFDFYLWLNDDTRLYDTGLGCMLDTYYKLLKTKGDEVIVAGSFCDEKSLKLTYGGSMLGSWWRATQYKMVQPSQVPQRCDLFNGNCVLIPRKIAMATGNMSSDYKHGSGDLDYALRAGKAGFKSWICPGYVGTCSRNSMLDRWSLKKLSMKERIDALNHPTIVARVEDWIAYVKKYHKVLWPYFYLLSYIRLRFPRLYTLLKTGFLLQVKLQSKP